MKLTIILTLAVIALTVSLIMCYSVSKPLRDKAKKEAIDAANAKRVAEEQGRERNRKDNLKREVLQIVSDAVLYPENLRGLSAPYPHKPTGFRPLADFIHKADYKSEALEELGIWKHRVATQGNQIRDLQAQLKEIQKALKMGQPVDF